MRTTLAIDDDVLTAARALDDQQPRSVGEVNPGSRVRRCGVPLVTPRSDTVVTLELVKAPRDEAT